MCWNFILSKILSSNVISCNLIYNANGIFKSFMVVLSFTSFCWEQAKHSHCQFSWYSSCSARLTIIWRAKGASSWVVLPFTPVSTRPVRSHQNTFWYNNSWLGFLLKNLNYVPKEREKVSAKKLPSFVTVKCLGWFVGIILGEIMCESSNWQHIQRLKITNARCKVATF